MAKNKSQGFQMCTPRCLGAKLVILGFLVTINTLHDFIEWGVFMGVLIALIGIMLIVKSSTCRRK